jgi:hypothetical protein
MGEFWDTHDLSDYWNQTHPAKFDIDIQSEEFYYPLEAKLSRRVQTIAKQRGVSPETLLHLWVQEKLQTEKV